MLLVQIPMLSRFTTLSQARRCSRVIAQLQLKIEPFNWSNCLSWLGPKALRTYIQTNKPTHKQTNKERSKERTIHIHIHTHSTRTHMLPDVNHEMVQLKRFKWMHQLTTGVTTGGSLALVYRLLSWADSQPWYPPAAEVCEALSGGGWRLDYPSFIIGVTVGICIYLFVEFAVTLRWALVN